MILFWIIKFHVEWYDAALYNIELYFKNPICKITFENIFCALLFEHTNITWVDDYLCNQISVSVEESYLFIYCFLVDFLVNTYCDNFLINDNYTGTNTVS